MSTLKELRDVRLEKLSSLKKLGVNPYPAKSNKNTQVDSVVKEFEKLNGSVVIIAGRVMSIRVHGKLVFMDIKDESGRVQL
ncbi:MAG: lysyl-tRNA synthetase, partial [uncultured bacterium]